MEVMQGTTNKVYVPDNYDEGKYNDILRAVDRLEWLYELIEERTYKTLNNEKNYIILIKEVLEQIKELRKEIASSKGGLKFV